MFIPTLAVALPLLGGAFAAPTAASRSSYAVKERHVVPRGWTAVAPAARAQVINLQIALKQSNEDKLEQHAVEVSDPSHARYGQYLSADEVHELIAPSDETIDLVDAWLREHDIHTAALNPSRDWITVALPVGKVEELLDTSYSVFEHDDGSSLVRAPHWSLPQHLHEHIDVIQPTTSFFRPAKQASDVVQDGSSFDQQLVTELATQSLKHNGSCDISTVCNVTFTTLQCLRCLYGTADYKPLVPEFNSLAVTNYLNETQHRADLQKYFSLYRPDATDYANKFPIIKVANGSDDQTVPLTPAEVAAGSGIEGNLDGELAIGISYPTSFLSWVTGGSPPFTPDLNTPTDTNEPYVTWLNYVLAQKSLPFVISTSYGDDEQTVPLSYANKACDGFKQLAARGITVLFSSGDAGVGGNGTCFSNTDPSKAMFIPNFPAGCPWVTTVGATANFQPETAVTRFGSGAGFSNYFGRPAYQQGAVAGYLGKIGGLYSGLYNKSGRGYPDVAAQGNHDVIVYNNIVRTVGGTSASSPAFAAILALVNDALISSGHPRLGFINPWLYAGGYKALTDITIGSSIGCNTAGFPATDGWDAVTGFGTPNFNKLVAAAFFKLPTVVTK